MWVLLIFLLFFSADALLTTLQFDLFEFWEEVLTFLEFYEFGSVHGSLEFLELRKAGDEFPFFDGDWEELFVKFFRELRFDVVDVLFVDQLKVPFEIRIRAILIQHNIQHPIHFIRQLSH